MSLPTLIDRIDALLPQTQCTQCGYAGCRPYASAIANGQAPINRCPPGGTAGITALAKLLQTAPLPLDTSRGQPKPLAVAIIDEVHCIGCTRCIVACPVDAIVGAAKRMHTVLDDHCTGCERCIPTCPVDCITMVPAERPWTADDAHHARDRHTRRQQRLSQNAPLSDNPRQNAIDHTLCANEQSAREELTPLRAFAPPNCHDDTPDVKHTRIEMALARARARRTPPDAKNSP